MICYPSTTEWPKEAETFRDELTDDQRTRAEEFAWSILQTLTGYSLSICPVEVRPASNHCARPVYRDAPATGMGAGFEPYLSGGTWYNCGCGGACGCEGGGVFLPGPVGAIDSVTIGGTTLPATAYRVDNGSLLVRQDGDSWPACQDMSLPGGADGTWTVRYFRGDAPTAMDNWAAGVLAWEFAKAMLGVKGCRLPTGVTSVVRNGVSMELNANLFLDGTTGIREVDMVVAMRNPHRLAQPSIVKSPDSGRGRIPTWRA